MGKLPLEQYLSKCLTSRGHVAVSQTTTSPSKGHARAVAKAKSSRRLALQQGRATGAGGINGTLRAA